MPRSHTGEGATIISANIEYGRLHIRKNSLEKGEKVWSCDKKIFMLLQCSMMLFDCPESKPQQSKNILRKPYRSVKISINFSVITHELATGRGERMQSGKIPLQQRKNQLRTGKNVWRMYHHQETSTTG